MSNVQHVDPVILSKKLLKNNVFGKENERNKVQKSTASISDPAHMSNVQHVDPVILSKNLMKNDVFGKENERNKGPKSTALISDPAHIMSTVLPLVNQSIFVAHMGRVNNRCGQKSRFGGLYYKF